MKTARYRLSAGVTKEASVSEPTLVKEASELANALEYMAISTAYDGSSAGTARAEMVRDFFKSATAQQLKSGPTQAKGAQEIVPNEGKTKLKKVLTDEHGNPLESSSPDSKGKTMLESYKKANS